VLAVVQAGMLAGGSALSYARVEELLRDADRQVIGALVRDLETDQTHRVIARVVVNATGAWCDSIRGMLSGAASRLRPSRGSHLLFPRSRLPIEVAVTGLSPDDGRPVFTVPHPEGTLVGTTDLFHKGPLEEPRPSAEETAYLLRYAQAVFPSARLSHDDITGAFAGVRPILDSAAETPSEASREEEVWVEDGLVSTAGGKLTTYRATAEEVVDQVLKLLPEGRGEEASPVATAGAALPWRVDAEAAGDALRRQGAGSDVAAGMVRRLGAMALAAAAGVEREELRPVAPGLDLCAVEVAWHLRFGGVVRLEDLLLRRVRLGMWQPRRALELAPRLRPLVRRAAGWSVTRWNIELEAFERAVANWMPPERATASARKSR
jgi:glycerol-3-phosphate dehydrogenase